MALISFTLFGAFCTLLAAIGVVFFDVSVLLILQIYLGFCATLVFLGLAFSLTLPQKGSGRRRGERRKRGFFTKGGELLNDTDRLQTQLVASAGGSAQASQRQ